MAFLSCFSLGVGLHLLGLWRPAHGGVGCWRLVWAFFSPGELLPAPVVSCRGRFHY